MLIAFLFIESKMYVDMKYFVLSFKLTFLDVHVLVVERKQVLNLKP